MKPALLTPVVLLALLLAPALPAQAPARALSLDEAIRLAAPASEAVGIARAGVERARGQQAQARSELFPQLTGSASYTRTLRSQFSALARESDSSGTSTDTTTAPTSCARFAADPTRPLAERIDSLESAVACATSLDPFGSFRNLPFGQKNQYNLGLQFSQNLFAGGRIRAQTRIAGAARRSAEVELTSQQAELQLDVTQAYYDAVLSDRLLAIADSALAQAERTLGDTKLAREVGNVPEFDLLRAQVTRDNQRPVVIQRRSQREIAYLRLRQLLNLPLSDSLALTTSLGDTDSLTPASAAPAASDTTRPAADTAADRRVAVRKAAETVTAQENRVTVARAGSLPTLRLTSAFARIAYPSSGFPGWNDFLSDWTVSLAMQVPIFTGGRLRGDRIVAHADLDEARLRLQQTREQAALDARTSIASLDAAEAAWAASAGTVEQARRAYSIAEIRFREGISTQTELGDSRLLLQQAEANRAQAARDLRVARVRLQLLPNLPLGGAVVSTAPVAPTTPTAGSR
jgi:outer membrane protein